MRDDNHKKQIDDLFKSFEDVYQKSRNDISGKLQVLFTKLKGDIRDIFEIQPEMLNLRQQINDQMTVFLNKLLKINKKLREVEQTKVLQYQDHKKDGFSAKDISIMINNDLKEIVGQKELLEIHIEFLKDCRRSCDQIGFSIKNRNAIAVYL